MSSKSYAAKAQAFQISNPDSPASEGQLKQIGRLLRFKNTDVEYGNWAIERIAKPMNRAVADAMIKRLADCPDMPRDNVQIAARAAVKATAQVAALRTPNYEVIGRMVCDGVLGKVAQKKALAYIA